MLYSMYYVLCIMGYKGDARGVVQSVAVGLEHWHIELSFIVLYVEGSLELNKNEITWMRLKTDCSMSFIGHHIDWTYTII